MKKHKTAIIVYWFAYEEEQLAKHRDNIVVAFLPSRYSPAMIKKYLIERYLSSDTFSPEELLSFIESKKNIPALDSLDCDDGIIRIGWKPWLVAAQAENINFETMGDHKIIRWTEISYSSKPDMARKRIETLKEIRLY